MFPHRYFAERYFPPGYFPPRVSQIIPSIGYPSPSPDVHWMDEMRRKKKKRKKKQEEDIILLMLLDKILDSEDGGNT